MPKIIIADPNESDQTHLFNSLASLNIDDESILFCKNGHEVLELLDKHHVILVFIEWDMSELNGIELMKQIKRISHYSNIPFIMYTNVKEGEKVRLALMQGVSGYLVKPLDSKILKAKLAEIVKNKNLKLPMINKAENDKSEEIISNLNQLVDELEMDEERSHILIASEDVSYWNNYIKKSEARETFKFAYYSKLSDAVKLIKQRPPALIKLDYHFGETRIKSALEELSVFTTAHNIPIILSFDNATALHKLNSEKEAYYRELGVVELFNKETSFKKLYEKLGRVYVAWHATIEKLGKLVYVDPTASSYVETVKEKRQEREKRKEDALKSGEVGIIADPAFGFQFQIQPGAYLDPNQLKFQAILDLVHKKDYPTRFIVDFKNYPNQKVTNDEIDKILAFIQDVEELEFKNLTFVVSESQDSIIKSLNDYSSKEKVEIFKNVDEAKDYYFEIEQENSD